jgi:thioredoxin reductase
MKPPEQVIIIGGGPAGIACAVQLKRYGINPLLIEKDTIGGLVRNAWRIDNYPGFPDGINGADLLKKLQRHLQRFEVRYQISEVIIQNFDQDVFSLNDDTAEFKAKYVVVAAGTEANPITTNIPDYYSDKVFTEVYPLRSVKGKTIDIVGAGDAAFDYAMTLSKNNTVTIHNRSTRLKCIPALLGIARQQPNISYIENSNPSFSSDYTIFATGRKPSLGCLSDKIKDQSHELEAEGRLYFIGDIKNGMVRQCSVAIGDGVRTAMSIVKSLSENESN